MPATIAIAALGLLFMAGTANAEYHNFTGGITTPSPAERMKARERNKWIDRERARQEVQEYNREQERIRQQGQWGSRTLDRMSKQDGLYKSDDPLITLPAWR